MEICNQISKTRPLNGKHKTSTKAIGQETKENSHASIFSPNKGKQTNNNNKNNKKEADDNFCGAKKDSSSNHAVQEMYRFSELLTYP